MAPTALDDLDTAMNGHPTAQGPTPVPVTSTVPAPTFLDKVEHEAAELAHDVTEPAWVARLEAKIDQGLADIRSIALDVHAAKEGLDQAQQQLAPMMGGMGGMLKTMFGGGSSAVIPATTTGE